jgi:hypothetical protein
MNLEKLIPTDPAKHFGFAQCKMCWWTPCDRLRHGVIRPGRCIFLSRGKFGNSDCPFIIHSPGEVFSFLYHLDFFNLCFTYRNVLSLLTIPQHNTHNPDFFVDAYLDARGRIEYIMHLIANDILTVIGIPLGFERDKKINQFLYSFERNAHLPGEVRKKADDDDDAPALTDELAEEKKDISLSNLRWEHADEQMKNDSPEEAAWGNKLILKADVSGTGTGKEASFTILNTIVKPARKLATVSGKIKDGVATAEWVSDGAIPGKEKEGLKVFFEVLVKNKTSEQKEIVIAKEFVYSF